MKERNFGSDIGRNGGCDAMREIKFRGFNGEKWLYGNLDIDYKTKQATISDDRWWRHPVRFDTVGQFTGMYDCDGHEIYEGDILGNKYPSHYKFANAVVEWGVNGWLADCFTLLEWLKLHTCIVVGNIYDNSELLPELPGAKDARNQI